MKHNQHLLQDHVAQRLKIAKSTALRDGGGRRWRASEAKALLDGMRQRLQDIRFKDDPEMLRNTADRLISALASVLTDYEAAESQLFHTVHIRIPPPVKHERRYKQRGQSSQKNLKVPATGRVLPANGGQKPGSRASMKHRSR